MHAKNSFHIENSTVFMIPPPERPIRNSFIHAAALFEALRLGLSDTELG